ncbi:Bug family tripartite tricarboxylate transporter substrate binding protein [Hydrogenophaga sp. OTU3427]|uniref:Bug family tripartite tricarboxylate transporter substrate binding protein n=1 Tax=Hydrogenophaga sp. OTU3427 TaxID=3043856 RepID=UPI00313AD605
MNHRRLLIAAAATATLALACGGAMAQAYPNKAITVVVSFPPGGDTDALARVFAEKLSTRVGQPVVVENKTGASGTIGNAYVAKANPDGYTLLFTPNTIATAPLVLKPGTGAVYDPLTDFTPIVLAGTQSLFLVVNATSGITNLKDYVAAAKSGKISSYASPGSGSPMHILGEMFNKAAGVKLQQIPYRGSGPAVIDLVAGQIPAFYTTLGPVAQYIANGKLINIGVADPKRSPLQPNVPTFVEGGVKDAEVGAWQGFMGPKGMSADIVRTLNGHFNEILKMPDVQARMNTLALIPAGGAPDALAKINAEHNQRYGKVIKETGIMAD